MESASGGNIIMRVMPHSFDAYSSSKCQFAHVLSSVFLPCILQRLCWQLVTCHFAKKWNKLPWQAQTVDASVSTRLPHFCPLLVLLMSYILKTCWQPTLSTDCCTVLAEVDYMHNPGPASVLEHKC